MRSPRLSLLDPAFLARAAGSGGIPDDSFLWSWRANNINGANNSGVTYGATLAAVPTNLGGGGGTWNSAFLDGLPIIESAEALVWSGSGQYVGWSTTAGGSILPAEWVWGCRIKVPAAATPDDYVGGNTAGGGITNDPMLWLPNDRRVAMGFPGSPRVASGITNDVWHTILFGYDGANRFVEVDGVVTQQAAAAPTVPQSASFGGPKTSGTNYRMNRGAVTAYADKALLIEWLEAEV